MIDGNYDKNTEIKFLMVIIKIGIKYINSSN